MLDDGVARELPSEVLPVEISLWKDRRMNIKVDKWGRFGFWFLSRVEVFKKGSEISVSNKGTKGSIAQCI